MYIESTNRETKAVFIGGGTNGLRLASAAERKQLIDQQLLDPYFGDFPVADAVVAEVAEGE